MTTLQVTVPDELLELLGSREAAEEHVRRATVLDLVKRQTISQGRAAELLGMSPAALRDLMAEADVATIAVTEDELDEGHKNLKRALGRQPS